MKWKNIKCLTPPTRLGWLLLGCLFFEKSKQKKYKMVLPRPFVAVDWCCLFWKKRSGKNGVRLCWLVWFGLIWFGLAWLGLVWFGCFGLLVGWKNVGENSKMVVPRLFVAVDWCCLFWKKGQETKTIWSMSLLAGLVWLGLAWLGLVWLLWVVGWLKKCWGK